MKTHHNYLGNILITIFLLATLLMAGCKGAETTTTTGTTKSELAYTLITGGDKGGSPYLSEDAQIRIITDNKLATEITDMMTSDSTDPLLKVDYTHYFVIAAFNGWRGNLYNSFQIQYVEQIGNTILITATFNDLSIGITPATFIPAYSSQYQAVQLDRSIFPKTGTLTFKLLDENGTERASTIATFVNK